MKNGVVSFSDDVPMDRPYQVLKTGCYACAVDSQVNWKHIPLYTDNYSKTISEASKKFKVDPALVRAMIHAESSFKADAKSKAGAVGLMQLMPATAKEVGVKNRHDPQDNIHGGVKYLSKLIKRFKGNITLATAAYNAGPGNVSKYKGIPPFKETQAYVKRVNILRKRYHQTMRNI